MKNNTRFGLNKDCFLVRGAKRGAIYRLSTGDVYSIDEDSADLIENCEVGMPAEKILIGKSDSFQIEASSYLDNLTKEGIGRFLGEGDRIEKIKISEPPILEFIWLEITGRCNQRCVHCYLGNNPIFFEETRMKQVDWIRVMTQAHKMGCRKLQFIGGEPFIDYENLFNLILESRDIGYEFVEVYTNATLLDDDKINFLASQGVNVAVSVYGMNSNIHDQVTRTSDSFSKTVSNLKKMVAKGIQIRIGVIGMSINEEYINETVSFLRNDIGVRNIKVDLVRPIGCGCSKGLAPIKLLEKQKRFKPDFSKCLLGKFQRAFYGHNCFSKNLCIIGSGKAIPCIMERDILLGDVFDSSLEKILLDESTKKIRNLSKDFIEVCKDCEYRYCCFDCRPKAKQESGGNLFAKPSNCFYDPYLGLWKNL